MYGRTQAGSFFILAPSPPRGSPIAGLRFYGASDGVLVDYRRLHFYSQLVVLFTLTPTGDI